MGTGCIENLARETALAVRRETSNKAGLAVGVEELAVGWWGRRHSVGRTRIRARAGAEHGELDKGQGDLDTQGLPRGAVVRDGKVDLEDVGDVEEGGGVVGVRGGGVEVDGDGDRRRCGLETVAGVALVHEEGVGMLGIGDVVGLDACQVGREGDAVLGQEHERVRAQQRHFRRLLAGGWQRECARGIGRGEIRRPLRKLDREFVHAHTWRGRSQLYTQIKRWIRNVHVARHMQLGEDRARNVGWNTRPRRILDTGSDRVRARLRSGGRTVPFHTDWHGLRVSRLLPAHGEHG